MLDLKKENQYNGTISFTRWSINMRVDFPKENKDTYFGVLKICLPISFSIIIALIGVGKFLPAYDYLKFLLCIIALLNSIASMICVTYLFYGMFINRLITFSLALSNAMIGSIVMLITLGEFENSFFLFLNYLSNF